MNKKTKDLNIPGLQLKREITSICNQFLNNGAKRRQDVKNLNEWKKLRREYLKFIRNSFPEIIFKRNYPLNSRLVSKYEFKNFRIENVIFESLPGFEVNATIYLPKKEGIYPAIVCPSGHSSKATNISYQTSPQTFAMNGYIAVSFDAPWFGERNYLNDHFVQGIISYLVGIFPQTYFVIDAIRCIDYLETRPDVDKKAGFSITGVSGGGSTTYFSAMLDKRIKFFAPVCCLMLHKTLHLKDFYTSCPEQFGYKYIEKGLDIEDYLSISAPKPCLLIAGKKDEVFDYRWTIYTFKEVRKIYRLFGREENLNIFIDEKSGHAYTVKMANEVVKYLNKYIKKSSETPLNLRESDIEILEPDFLKCFSSNKVNMFTIIKNESERMKRNREGFITKKVNKSYVIQNIKENLGLDKLNFKSYSIIEEKNPPKVWHHTLQKIDIKFKPGYHIAGLLMKRDTNNIIKRPAFLFIDENGKWAELRHQRFLSKVGGFLKERDISEEHIIFSIDLSGFGEFSCEPVPFDLASWCDIERILTYLSISAGIPIMGLRVRDALCALDYIKNRSDVEKSKITIGGKGIGAVISLLAGLLDKNIRNIVLIDMLSSYSSITEKPLTRFYWKESILIPGILKICDIPEIVEILSDRNIYIINPLDSTKRPILFEEARKMYPSATILKNEEDLISKFQD